MTVSSDHGLRLGPLPVELDAAAAALCAEAFADNPAYVRNGPRDPNRRAHGLRRLYASRIWASRHWRLRPPVAAWSAGRLAGIVMVDEPGSELPWYGDAAQLPAVALAGPGVAGRALRAELSLLATRRRLDVGPRLRVGLLAVHPLAQGGGIGKRLLLGVLDEADQRAVPVVLETNTTANVSWYGRFDFEVAATDDMPGGVSAWHLRRLPAGPAGTRAVAVGTGAVWMTRQSGVVTRVPVGEP